METQTIDLIPLAEAVLCEDCHTISRAKNCHCLACGGRGLISVARVLEREDEFDLAFRVLRRLAGQ